MSEIEARLKGGDPRRLKNVSSVVDDVLHDPSRVDELVRAMSHDDAHVRMRAGDAAEKIGRSNPEYFQPHLALLLDLATTTEQASLRWHLAQLIPRLSLDALQRRAMVAAFRRYLDDRSAIVKTSALEAMADLSHGDAALRRTVVPLLRTAFSTGTAAMRARAGMLLEKLEHTKSRTR
jgi:HEAT repeat protein